MFVELWSVNAIQLIFNLCTHINGYLWFETQSLGVNLHFLPINITLLSVELLGKQIHGVLIRLHKTFIKFNQFKSLEKRVCF